MTLFNHKYRVESTRLTGWDYASPGWYFVTLCTKNHACVLGEIIDREIRLSAIGQLVAEEWLKSSILRSYIELDHWIIMPNHLHGIIILKKDQPVETPGAGVSPVPRRTKPPSIGSIGGVSPVPRRTRPPSIGSIIGQFKSATSKRVWAAGHRDFGWQARFFDHVIRNDES
ncbi:MAG: transposase, partial [Dehalococcoidia bacterium]|nr:transposase [Dehalococcoidia bacterium]